MKSVLSGLFIAAIIAIFAFGMIYIQDFSAEEIYQTESNSLRLDK